MTVEMISPSSALIEQIEMNKEQTAFSIPPYSVDVKEIFSNAYCVFVSLFKEANEIIIDELYMPPQASLK